MDISQTILGNILSREKNALVDNKPIKISNLMVNFDIVLKFILYFYYVCHN